MSGPPSRPPGLVSVIIPVFSPSAITPLCLAALARHSRPPWELIAIANGVSDASTCLKRLRGAADRIEILPCPESHGLTASCEVGVRAARGQYLVFLDQDVVVTEDWLDQLIALANADPQIALVGAMSNHASPGQLVSGNPSTDLAAMERFAARWRSEHRGQWAAVERLDDFCVLITRTAADQLVVPEESWVPGLTVNAWALRAREAGLSLAVARDLFVHRFEHWTDAWHRVGRSWDQIPGMFDFASVYDAAVAAAAPHAVFVEVGCLAGRSTCYLASAIRASGKDITVYAVDSATGSPTDTTGRVIVPAMGGSLAGILHRNILGCGLEPWIVPIVTTSARAARLFNDGTIDFCFIDGDHRYESVTADLRCWWPKIRPGGMLAGHDYRQSASWLQGVTPAVHDFFGVRDASHPAMPACWAVVKEEPSPLHPMG